MARASMEKPMHFTAGKPGKKVWTPGLPITVGGEALIRRSYRIGKTSVRWTIQSPSIRRNSSGSCLVTISVDQLKPALTVSENGGHHFFRCLRTSQNVHFLKKAEITQMWSMQIESHILLPTFGSHVISLLTIPAISSLYIRQDIVFGTPARSKSAMLYKTCSLCKQVVVFYRVLCR